MAPSSGRGRSSALAGIAMLGWLGACAPEAPTEPFRKPSTGWWAQVRVGIWHACALSVADPTANDGDLPTWGEVRCWGAAPKADGSLPLFDHAPRGTHTGLGLEHVGDESQPELACAYNSYQGGSCWGRGTYAPIDIGSPAPAGMEMCSSDSTPFFSFRCRHLESKKALEWLADEDQYSGVRQAAFGPGLLAAVDEAGVLLVELNAWEEAPTPVPEGNWMQVAQGGLSGALCAIRDSGGLYCWRAVEGPTLGITDTPEGDFEDVCLFTGRNAACALDMDGHAVCWGDDAPDTPSRSFASLSCGHTSVCGQLDDGRVQCWGACAHGECDLPE